VSSPPAGCRFPREVIAVAVSWYLRYGLSYRDVEELLGERGIEVDHVTIYRWVQTFTAEFINAARPTRHATGDRWFVDETHVKVAGRWTYLHRCRRGRPRVDHPNSVPPPPTIAQRPSNRSSSHIGPRRDRTRRTVRSDPIRATEAIAIRSDRGRTTVPPPAGEPGGSPQVHCQTRSASLGSCSQVSQRRAAAGPW
jgi:hypothetical protein